MLDRLSSYQQNERNEDWNLDIHPNPNAIDRFVFETVQSLLQHWPNTRMRNGERSVPCLAFPRTRVSPQAMTSYQEAFRLEHSSTMGGRAKSYHRVRNFLLQVLSVRISEGVTEQWRFERLRSPKCPGSNLNTCRYRLVQHSTSPDFNLSIHLPQPGDQFKPVLSVRNETGIGYYPMQCRLVTI